MSAAVAMLVNDPEDHTVSWLLIGIQETGTRFAQARGPRETSLEDLDQTLTGLGWARTGPWQTTEMGFPATSGVQIQNTNVAEIYVRRANNGEIPREFLRQICGCTDTGGGR